MEVRDQLNRKCYFHKIPSRIISLVPSQTELLIDLGLEDSIVGITKFCVHPKDLKKSKTVVGGTKQIHLDRIRELKPDIILCNKEENTKDILELCETICNVHVSDVFNIKDSLELINQYGTIFNKKEQALSIVSQIKIESEKFKTFIQNKPDLKVAYFIWKKPWMVAANNTFINYLLSINKFENVFEKKVRYPEIELTELSSNPVDLILLSSEPFPFKEAHIEDIKAYSPDAQILLVDGEMFSWYGSRLIWAFTYFKNLRLSLQNSPPC